MKSLRKLSLTNLVAAVAAAGLSLSAAYAAPIYSPDINSPINTPDGAVDLGAGLDLINDALVALYPTKTLVFPAVNAGPTALKPTATEYKAAVKKAAFDATSDADKAAIVRSALFAGPSAYGANVTKDVVRQVLADYIPSAGYSQAGAISILNAALTVNNGKSNDVMAGAILAIGDVGTPTNEAESDEYAAGALAKVGALSDDQPKKVVALIEGLAEQAIKNMKANAAGTTGFNAATMQATVNATAAGLIDAVEATGSVALLSNVAKGIVKGSKALASNGVTLAPVYAAISAATAANAESQSFAFVGVARTIVGTLVTEQDSASLAFGNTASILATKKGYFDIANSVSSARVSTLSTLIQGDPSNAAYYITGAVSIVSAIAGPGITSSIQFAPNNAAKIAMVVAASRASNAQAAKAAGAAANAATVGNISVGDALTAALSNTPAIYAGAVAKEVTKGRPLATESELVTAAVDALEAAAAVHPEDNFKAGIVDVIAEISKIRKTAPQLSNIIAAGIGALPAGSGYAEAVAVAIGRQDKLGNHTVALNAALAGIGASPAEVASVLKADEVAKAAITNKAASLNLGQLEMRTGPVTNLGGILLAVGAAEKKFTNVLLATALRHGSSLTTPEKELLLAHAKSVNKALEGETQIAYDVATLILADPNSITLGDNPELFDIVDHKALMHPKAVGVVAGAAAAAAPKYAHYVARAAAFRASASELIKIPAAVFQGADMNSNTANNPAASAAIAAAYILGIKDKKSATTTLENTLIKNGMTALVKAALTIGDRATASFRGVDLLGAFGTDRTEYGSAAAVSGATSILSNVGVFTPSAALLAVLQGAGKAAGKVANKTQIAPIAQAAMQAFAMVTGLTSEPLATQNAAKTAIINALVLGSGAASALVTSGADAGLAEAILGNFGAGAAGVLNYAHFNCNNSPVTDIAGF